MSPKKVLIMPNPAEREVAPRSESESLPLAPGHPVLPNDIRLVFTALDLYRSLGRLEKAVEVLEAASAQHQKDLNGLGKVAHSAVFFGKIALAFVAGGGLIELLRILITHHW